MKELTTDLDDDEILDEHNEHDLRLIVDGYRNGNYNLFCQDCLKTICRFQNNE